MNKQNGSRFFLRPVIRDKRIVIKEWERIKQQLDRSGIITIFDMASLAAYCQLYSRWVQLENDIKVEGLTIESIRYNKNGDVISTTEIINPKVKEARLTLQQMRAFCSEFGITPSSRSRLSVKPAEDEDEGMEQFFKDGVS